MSFKDLDLSSGASKYLKLVDGDNKLRIVSEPVQFWFSFDAETKTAKKYLNAEAAAMDEKATKRFAMWVIDRVDGLVKLAEFGPGIMKQIQGHANDADYGFDGLPPYDFKIKKTGSALLTKYTVVPLQPSELTESEIEEVAGLQDVKELLSKDADDII